MDLDLGFRISYLWSVDYIDGRLIGFSVAMLHVVCHRCLSYSPQVFVVIILILAFLCIVFATQSYLCFVLFLESAFGPTVTGIHIPNFEFLSPPMSCARSRPLFYFIVPDHC